MEVRCRMGRGGGAVSEIRRGRKSARLITSHICPYLRLATSRVGCLQALFRNLGAHAILVQVVGHHELCEVANDF